MKGRPTTFPCTMAEENAVGRKLWPTSDVRSAFAFNDLIEHFLCHGRWVLGVVRPTSPDELAFDYACWTIQSELFDSLGQFMDFMTDDDRPVPSSPREVLVGVLRAAMLVNSPSAVQYVLNYARAKWTEEDLRDAANCLCGECDGLDGIWSHSPHCCAWIDSEITDLPFTILASFFMARTKVTDLMVEFVESLGVKIREKLWRHLAQQEDDDVGPPERLLRASSRGDEEEVRILLAEGVNPDDGRDADMFGRTPLMHAIYHKKPSMVEALLQAGSSTNAESCDIDVPLMVAIANATELIDILCVDHDGKFFPRSAPWLLEVASGCNSVGVFRAVVSRCETQLLESHFSTVIRGSFWYCGSRFSFEIAETMLPHLLSSFGKCSMKYTRTVQALLNNDCPNVLRVFLSHESFYKNTEKSWYVLLDGHGKDGEYAYPSTVCVRILLGEGLCINPRDDTLPTITVLHDAVEVNCTHGPCQAIPSSRSQSHPAGLW